MLLAAAGRLSRSLAGYIFLFRWSRAARGCQNSDKQMNKFTRTHLRPIDIVIASGCVRVWVFCVCSGQDAYNWNRNREIHAWPVIWARIDCACHWHRNTNANRASGAGKIRLYLLPPDSLCFFFWAGAFGIISVSCRAGAFFHFSLNNLLTIFAFTFV